MARVAVEAHAGVTAGVAHAYAPTVETGTPLSPQLLEIASISATQSASTAPGSNDELHGCLVAVLCAHAALEAGVNEAGERQGDWWTGRERHRIEKKWADLVTRLAGTRPPGSSAARAGVRRLNRDRNLIAHFRGVPMPDGKVRVSGPPVKARGGITLVRAYFDAQRAADRLKDAEQALAAISRTE